jgi:hypothetical protein
MKKLTILLTFICLTAVMQAQSYSHPMRFYPAKIAFENGEVIECVARMPMGDVVYYKLDASGGLKSIKHGDKNNPMHYVLYMPEEEEHFLMEYMQILSLYFIEKPKKRPKQLDFAWRQMWINGPVNLYGLVEAEMGSFGNVRSRTTNYFVKRGDEDFATQVHFKIESGRKVTNSTYAVKNFHIYGAEYFSDYPELATKIASKVSGYQAEDIVQIVNE